jgi:hypothetical protein
MKRNVLKIFLVLFMAWDLLPSAMAQIERYSPITDPTISGHCRAMLKDRDEKIKFRQKLGALILRNKNLQEKTNPNKRTVLSDLQDNLKILEREYFLSRIQIQRLTEGVIKRGCPGINL